MYIELIQTVNTFSILVNLLYITLNSWFYDLVHYKILKLGNWEIHLKSAIGKLGNSPEVSNWEKDDYHPLFGPK